MRTTDPYYKQNLGNIDSGPENKSHNLAQYTVRLSYRLCQGGSGPSDDESYSGSSCQNRLVRPATLCRLSGSHAGQRACWKHVDPDPTRISDQQSVFVISRQNRSLTVHGPRGCCLSRTTTTTWACWECLASLLLSLADSRGVLSISGVRGTGKASARGSQNTNNSNLRAGHLQVWSKIAKNYRRVKMLF